MHPVESEIFPLMNGALPDTPQNSTNHGSDKKLFIKKTQAFHERLVFFGGPSGTRTLDTLIKSQVLYQLS